MRRIFMFLFEKLPKESEKVADQQLEWLRSQDEEPRQASGSQLELQKQSSEEETEAKVKQMQSQLESISEVISQLEGQEKEVSAALQQISGDIEKKKAQRLELESQNELEHKALALLPNADENILKLQAKNRRCCSETGQLIDANETQQKLEEIKAIKDKMREISEQARTKEEMHKQLDAKKDEAVRRAYKYLASVHENSNQLLQAVEETGSITREMRDLEDQIEQESQKKVTANLERITADYKQMKQENASLLAQLKGQ
ncbi:hypothetical protein HPB52_013713 [Rhipicephalus sanguineus]|uniref:Coiled-coil domain-containing protein 22 homolog n=1 Tax=Rhipicephalus sanguineus TaxID=34632 RepID=A0A9D4Q7I4_RHISA|nr:hypothetical protein HPB52_013713 [Rhipicephalus sanguineus]